jgi:integrase
MTVSELLYKYMDEKSVYVSEGTLSFYKDHIDKLVKYFKKLDVEKLNKESVTLFIKTQQTSGKSNNTINHEVGILKAAFRYFNLSSDFLKMPKLTIDFITHGHLDQFKQITINKILPELSLFHRCLISVFLDTGVRLSELINIELENVDFENRSIFLKRTKTHRTRYVFYTSETSKLIKLYLKDVEEGRKWLFLSTKNNKLTISCVEQIFTRIRKRFGLDKFSPHMLRHTFSTNLYNNRADLVFIETVMGHSNTETTKRYIHTDVKANRDKYDRIRLIQKRKLQK